MSAITVTGWGHEPLVRGSRPVGRGAGGTGRQVRSAAPAAPATRSTVADGARKGGALRLTARGRVVVWCVALGVAAGVGLSAQSAIADAPGAALPVETHVVAPGETLWQIAGTVAAPGQDLRDVVAELVELNGLGDAGLQAGQEILVPAA